MALAIIDQVATGKKKIADLEDEILRLLSESTGSLLDDMNLVNTLQDSKTISEEVTLQLQASEKNKLRQRTIVFRRIILSQLTLISTPLKKTRWHLFSLYSVFKR